MAKKEDAQKAIQEPNPIIDGRKANVNLAYIGAKPRLMQSKFSIQKQSINVVKFPLEVSEDCTKMPLSILKAR